MVLKGSMTMEQRDRMIDAFTHDATVTVFLMSLKAGGASKPQVLSHDSFDAQPVDTKL